MLQNFEFLKGVRILISEKIFYKVLGTKNITHALPKRRRRWLSGENTTVVSEYNFIAAGQLLGARFAFVFEVQ